MKREFSKAEIYSLAMGLFGLIIFTIVWQIDRDFAYGLTGYGIISSTGTTVGRTTGTLDAISAIFWIGGCIICIYRIVTISQENKFLLYFWAIFCFLCAGEELKWGQHIFHYSLKTIQNMNYQGEISVHNLNITRKFLLSPDRLFLIGFFIYFFIIPILMMSKYFNKVKAYFHYIIPSLYFIAAIWVPFWLSRVYGHVLEKGKPWYDVTMAVQSETREMYYALVVLVYAFLYLGRQE